MWVANSNQGDDEGHFDSPAAPAKLAQQLMGMKFIWGDRGGFMAGTENYLGLRTQRRQVCRWEYSESATFTAVNGLYNEGFPARHFTRARTTFTYQRCSVQRTSARWVPGARPSGATSAQSGHYLDAPEHVSAAASAWPAGNGDGYVACFIRLRREQASDLGGERLYRPGLSFLRLAAIRASCRELARAGRLPGLTHRFSDANA